MTQRDTVLLILCVAGSACGDWGGAAASPWKQVVIPNDVNNVVPGLAGNKE